jgi:hypothetical protein
VEFSFNVVGEVRLKDENGIYIAYDMREKAKGEVVS